MPFVSGFRKGLLGTAAQVRYTAPALQSVGIFLTQDENVSPTPLWALRFRPFPGGFSAVQKAFLHTVFNPGLRNRQ